MSLASAAYVWAVNDNFPLGDDWHLVPVYTGSVSVTPAWLWEQYTAHRLPLPKLLLVLAGAVSGHDYRAGMFLNALFLSALTALMIAASGRLCGGPAFSDAFFPLALLHWGQYETLMISYAVNLVASTVLAGVALVILVEVRRLPSPRQALLFGGCLLALPLCGSSGAALVPLLALWLGLAGAAYLRPGSEKRSRAGVFLVTLAVASAAWSAGYFLSLKRLPTTPPAPSAADAGRTALEFLSNSAGPAAETVWPVSGVLTAALLLVAGLKLLRVWRDDPAERLRTLGLACFGGAMLVLAAGVGWGRGSLGPAAGFATRYVTLAAPLLCLLYFVGRASRDRVWTWGLLLLTVALLAVNTSAGVARAQVRRERMRQIDADLARGMAPAPFADKWLGIIFFKEDGAAVLAERLEMLRRAGQGPFARPSDD
jgi:hypothetical protein